MSKLTTWSSAAWDFDTCTTSIILLVFLISTSILVPRIDRWRVSQAEFLRQRLTVIACSRDFPARILRCTRQGTRPREPFSAACPHSPLSASASEKTAKLSKMASGGGSSGMAFNPYSSDLPDLERLRVTAISNVPRWQRASRRGQPER